MRQYAGFGTAEETNERFRRLLAAGQSGLSTAFDLPTQMGFDSDHPMAHGEVGRVGVAIDTVDDLADLFRGIPLDRVSTSMTINATAAILLAMAYLARTASLADDNIRRAMVYGAAMGSYAVEQFGIRGFEQVTVADVERRVRAFQDLTHVELAEALP